MKSFFAPIFVVLLGFTVSVSYGYPSKKSLYSNYLKGIYFMQKQEPSLAQSYLEKAKDNWPDSIYIRHKIATALVQQNKIDSAKKVLKEAKRIDPDNLDTYLALIFIYSYIGEDERLEDEYEDFLQKAYQKKPEDLTILSYLAQFYFYQGRLDEAVVLYEEILAGDPQNLEILFWLGYLYYETGSEEKAIDTWKEGLLVEPDYAPILNALGYTYAERGVKLDKAKEMIKKALEFDPHNGAYLDSLGWVYFKKGELDKAKKYIKKALSYVEDPEIYYHLGVIYIELSQKEKGLEVYRKGLEKFPDYPELKEALQKYDQKENKENKE